MRKLRLPNPLRPNRNLRGLRRKPNPNLNRKSKKKHRSRKSQHRTHLSHQLPWRLHRPRLLHRRRLQLRRKWNSLWLHNRLNRQSRSRRHPEAESFRHRFALVQLCLRFFRRKRSNRQPSSGKRCSRLRSIKPDAITAFHRQRRPGNPDVRLTGPANVRWDPGPVNRGIRRDRDSRIVAPLRQLPGARVRGFGPEPLRHRLSL